MLYVAILIVFFAALNMNAFSIDWVAKGSNEAGIIVERAWWRTITALTLHAEFGHLLGNIVFGVIVGHFVAQCFGTGLAWLLILIAGSLGNGFNAFIQFPGHNAIGASVALFGGFGILSGYAHGSYAGLLRTGLRRWLAIAAGFTLVAFLGFGGENADVLGHILGFAAGVAIGLFLSRAPQNFASKIRIQQASAMLTLGLVSLSWLVALSR